MAALAGKTWTSSEIRDNILRFDSWAKKALLALYRNQTAEERIYGCTIQKNGRGFNGVDSELLTSLAEQYISKGFLTQKQISILRKKIVKYCKQLSDIANRGKGV